MQGDFHYYATFCAAYLAGWSYEESLDICYAANFTDFCSAGLLASVGAPVAAATTQTTMEMAGARMDIQGIQNITRIWSSFHFLPGDLYSDPPGRCSKRYKNKYRLICRPNSDLLEETVRLAKGRSLQHVGISMHVLADTWAHSYFAGTPSLVINNTYPGITELIPDGSGGCSERKVVFRTSAGNDDIEKGRYVNSIFQQSENSVLNLGHGRCGHLPDYSFIRYSYLPAWGNYEMITKDNPSDYWNAFCQMVYALKYLKGKNKSFEKNSYDVSDTAPYKEEIMAIMEKRQLNANADWKSFCEKLSGHELPVFDSGACIAEYRNSAAEEHDFTVLGKFVLGALAQKSMVTNKIYKSGNRLAGYSVDFSTKGFRGIKDFKALVNSMYGGRTDE